METKPTVFVVNENPGICQSLTRLLQSIQIPIEFYSRAADFLQAVDAERRGCAILDVRIADMSGVELQQIMQDRGIRLPVIILTAFGDIPTVIRCMKAGAVDFFQKPFDEQLLLEAIWAALRRNQAYWQQHSETNDIKARLQSLTEAERQVVDRLLMGKSYKQIAKELHISYRTVQYRRAQILQKMGTDDVPSLAMLVTKVRLALSA
ncbi:MAG TPA: response regulator [Gemmataceae bacterium]|nr:response regulator [Gemmataceae bacterium]